MMNISLEFLADERNEVLRSCFPNVRHALANLMNSYGDALPCAMAVIRVAGGEVWV